MEQKQHTTGISSGFIIGFLLGIVVTLLFTTKRGRDIVRMLTEKGAEKIDSWKDVLDATEEEFLGDEALSNQAPIVHEAPKAKPADVAESKSEKTAPASREKSSDPAKKPLHRFFRKPK